MPNQIRRQNSIDLDEPSASGNEKTLKPSPTKSKPGQKEKPAAKIGWFGGIFSGFGLRPKNQMKLPDDKNPSIVWDETRKKWVNLDEDGLETSNEIKPPPKMADMIPKVQQNLGNSNSGQPGIPDVQQPFVPYQHADNLSHNMPQNQFSTYEHAHNLNHVPGQQAPYGVTPANPTLAQGNSAGAPSGVQLAPIGEEAPKSTQPNMFKLQRGRNLKKSYVDVFNPGGKSSENSQSVAQNPVFLNAPAPSTGSHGNYFVPAPVNDPNAPVDFLTPANVNADNSQKKGANKS
ncbi:hypothetical protein AMK59_373 [Oryctes borbonicus]|uniref:Uncharacterized protein n=1 Tax=Oryctes borbonicus TaxID=1629725 RepID=A0A0T6BA97_9SCAR|nr:hypothetical protein AMK59_373 [Oryctes borbonicus]